MMLQQMEQPVINSELEKYLTSTADVFGGVQFVFAFPNNYGASVVRHAHSYGGKRGLWEVAVLGKDGVMCYDTPITNDVIGYLSWQGVLETLTNIFQLLPQTQALLN